MLENAIAACPDELWFSRTQQPEFWYVAYHTLFFLDLYLSESADGFAPPAPFGLDEIDPNGVRPKPFSKSEIRGYLQYGRAKCRALIDAMTDEHASRQCHFRWL